VAGIGNKDILPGGVQVAAATSGQVSDDGGKLTAGLPKPFE
jgi:hypothetical protein